MTPSPNIARAGRRESKSRSPEQPFKVVFFYEDFDAAIHCREAFDSIAHSVGKGRPVSASSWSFSVLGSSEFNAAILMDASSAEAIVIAARGDRELPSRVATWIEMCVNGCKKPVPLLIALHAEELEPEGEAAPFCSSLECIASRQGTTAMCGRDLKKPAGCVHPVATSSRQSAHAGGVLDPGTYRATGAHRWWGIND